MAEADNLSSVMNSTINPPSVAPAPLYPYEARVVLACLCVLVAVLGIVGNSLVIGSVILSKKLRTMTNAFVVNLSVADLWTSLSYPWQAVAVSSLSGWPVESEIPCIIAAVQFYTGLGASLYSLAIIALNRFVIITQTTATYRRWYSTGKVIGMIAVTWIIPCVVFFFPPMIGVGSFGYDPEDTTCSDKDGEPGGAEYNLAQSVGLYPVPMFIILCSYLAIYIYLKRHFRKQKTRRSSQVANPKPTSGTSAGECTTSFIVTTESQCGRIQSDKTRSDRRAISRQQLAITKNLFLVFCVFFLLISPYFISLAIPSSRKFALYGATITILNSCVNPIIYTVNHPNFNVVLRKMITCRYSEIPEPSNCLKSLLSRNV